VAFRDAHAIVGAIVRKLVAEGRDFASLSLEEWRALSDRIGPDVGEAISAKASVAAKRTPQSTNPDAVRAALDELAGWIAARRR
jgi:argininosuccinate lyase